MAVYVDSMNPCLPNPNWKWKESCHLFADSPEELHNFAYHVLGFPHSWFHSGSSTPHYDLTRNKRRVAIQAGAIEIKNDNNFSDFLQRIRDQWA